MQTTSRLVALDVTLNAIQLLAPIVQRIRRQDKDLTDQLRRAASSIALNLSEANGSDPGTARARWHSALGSTRETRTALQVAVAWHYISESQRTEADAQLDRVGALTWGLIHRR